MASIQETTKCSDCLNMIKGKDSKFERKMKIFSFNHKSREIDISMETELEGMLEIRERDCLCTGKISKEVLKDRRSIIDWMMIVSSKLEFSDECFFLAIEILDEVLIHFQFQLETKEIHLISIASLFISMKWVEVGQIPAQIFAEKVAYNEFTKDKIIDSELIILKILKFKKPQNVFLDFAYLNVNKMIPHENCDYKNILLSLVLTNYKLALYDYKLLRKASKKVLYSSIIYSAILKLNSYLSNRTHRVIILKLEERADSMKVKLEEIKECSNLILSLLKEKSTNDDFKYLNSIEFKKFRDLSL